MFLRTNGNPKISPKETTVRKSVIFAVTLLAAFAFMASANVAYACGGKPCSPACKKSCPGMTNAKQASADDKDCDAHYAWHKDCTLEANHKPMVLSVKGMTCGGCESSVTTALSKQAGVLKVNKVDHKDGVAYVCVDVEKCCPEDMIKAVAAKGFTAEVIPAVAVTTDDSENVNAQQVTTKKTGSCTASQKKTADGSL
jgi:copper chaperone CopZ